jgi:diguanylate cyclase (GGDEF)-like protein
MPELDGFGLLKVIRAHQQLRHLPVVVLTGDSTRAAADAALAAGATSYLTKPLNWPAFGAHIKHVADVVHVARLALDSMEQGLALFDRDGGVLLSNRTYLGVIEAPSPESDRVPGWVLEGRRALEDCATVERLTQLADGRHVNSEFRPLKGGGWVEVHRDVTEQRRREAKIRYLARHDSLTGLFHRAEFNDRIGRELAKARRGEPVAVLCLDLDHFKPVNDTLGHFAGDGLLRAVAERLRRCVRETDVIARIGGDEFAIIQTGSEQPDGSGALARRVIDVMTRPFEIDGHQITIGASVGIALAPTDSLDADTLLRKADIALYRAKALGRGGYCYFELGMDAAMQARRRMELDLRMAIAREEFELHYQPLLSLKTGCITGFEALVRWRHPEHGLVRPDVFIPLAEEIGLISDIGSWVLRRACRDASAWPKDLDIAVNVSACQFTIRGLADVVRRSLADAGLAPHRLQLEITETALIKNAETVLEILHDLREQGVRIVMDDFGTGYSSLNYLRKFPFDKLKIDKSFIDHIVEDAQSAAIVTAMMQLARTLGIKTTAEGVESVAQREKLESLNCDEVQGFLISRPLADVTEILAATA